MVIARALGARVKRREDPRLITGKATYVDDISLPGILHVAIVRSPHAHAKITVIDTAPALQVPGVVTVWTGKEIAARCGPLPVGPRIRDMKVPRRYPLVIDDMVRHVGDPIAAVVATDLAAARDAVDRVEVDYTPLAAVTDVEVAMRPDAPVIHPDLGTNICYRTTFGSSVDEIFARAEVTVSFRLVQQRLIPCAMETRGVVAQHRGDELTLWTSTQIPHVVKTMLAEIVRIPEHQIRVIAPEVGGGFGSKLDVYGEEALTAALAIALGRPVKWVETRREAFMATTHGRGQVQHVEAAATKDGMISALRLRVLADMGAYSQLLTLAVPTNTGRMSSGCYRIPAIFAEVIGIFTNRTPTGAYRGAGRPEATFLIERVVDVLAHRLRLDPAEIRRRNFIPPEAFPYKTATGATYDSGNYRPALEKALELVDYAALRTEQRQLRERGRYLGIGIASYVEITGLGAAAALPGGLWESATVRVEPTGKVTVLTGSSPHGQGQETSFAQIVSDRLGIGIDDVVVIHGDTRAVPHGVGTYGSRNTALGGSAVYLASERIKEKATKIAAHMLEASPADIVLDGARFAVRGSPERAVQFADVARAAYKGARLPAGMEPGLEATHFFAPPDAVFPFGTHICVVELDPDSGEVTVRRYVAVDDCGNILNPLLVAGQVHGGIVQGMAQALYEEAIYDESGQLLTAGFPDYVVPKAAQVSAFELAHTVTPSPHNPLGVKGVGEAGTIGATPAVVNAVLDALAPFGVEHLDMPLTPRKVWEAIRSGQGAARSKP